MLKETRAQQAMFSGTASMTNRPLTSAWQMFAVSPDSKHVSQVNQSIVVLENHYLLMCHELTSGYAGRWTEAQNTTGDQSFKLLTFL